MFGIGFFEILIIVFLILIFIKPEELPNFVRKAGKIYSQIKNAYYSFLRMLNSYSSDFKDMLELDQGKEAGKEEKKVEKQDEKKKPARNAKKKVAKKANVKASEKASKRVSKKNIKKTVKKKEEK